MPEEKVAVKVTEVPEEGYMPEGDAPFSETADKATAEAEKESAGEISEAEEIAEAIKPGEAETGEAKTDEVNEVEQILAEPKTEEDKSKVQRRIDDLVREKRLLEERLSKLEFEKTAKEGKTPEYTEAQLRTAMKKAVDDGDSDLVMDIMDYRIKKMEDNLVKRYQEDKQSEFQKVRVIQEEWNQTVDAYSKYADTKIQPLYPGSHKDLNLTDGASLLYQVAMALYSSNDPEKVKYYRGPGGQKLAVADALNYILSKKAGSKGKDSETERLKRQLVKEKRKKSIVSGSAGEEDRAPRKPMTDAERLEEVIEERKKYQIERGV